MADVQSLLDDAIAILDRAGLAWAIMGGCARNAYADRADITAVVAAQRMPGEPIDWKYIERWCDTWESGDRLRALHDGL